MSGWGAVLIPVVILGVAYYATIVANNAVSDIRRNGPEGETLQEGIYKLLTYILFQLGLIVAVLLGLIGKTYWG